MKFVSKGTVTAWNYQVGSKRIQKLDPSKDTQEVKISIDRDTKIESEIIGSGSRTSCVATVNVLKGGE